MADPALHQSYEMTSTPTRSSTRAPTTVTSRTMATTTSTATGKPMRGGVDAYPEFHGYDHDAGRGGHPGVCVDNAVHAATLWKLDCILLPFLAVLFLFNALDKSNIGNAESAHFTRDIGLEKRDLNTAVVLFFSFFVALQPLGAAAGRRFGMRRWVPSCMLLWGMATAAHVWVQHSWHLYVLRAAIGCLEAGFYPVTVSYLSQFYTRFEFGRRLSLFYGQAAVGGALGGLLSFGVFSWFPEREEGGMEGSKEWRSWQVLFLVEGILTMMVALLGYVWLPDSADTAWFLSPDERRYAASRVLVDREQGNAGSVDDDEEECEDEESRNLLGGRSRPRTQTRQTSALDDRGLTPHEIFSALTDTKIWHILVCNILSSIPVYAFSVFLPLVLAPLTSTSTPALVNLLTTPPHIAGAALLYLFARYSDRARIRLKPILAGLVIMVAGLSCVVALPESWALARYASLTVLVSGSYIASPLTVAWIAGNTPSPGKRALLLGINGWGNLAGVVSAALYTPKHAPSGYIVPFWYTLGCVALAAIGYVVFLRNVVVENERRRKVVTGWSEIELQREIREGRGSADDKGIIRKVVSRVVGGGSVGRLGVVGRWLREATMGGREGDEKMTFVYGL